MLLLHKDDDEEVLSIDVNDLFYKENEEELVEIRRKQRE